MPAILYWFPCRFQNHFPLDFNHGEVYFKPILLDRIGVLIQDEQQWSIFMLNYKTAMGICLLWVVLFSQDYDVIEPVMLINKPTAGTLLRGSFRGSLLAYPEGGMLGGLDAGVTDRLMFGISYGGTNVIGTGDVNWNPQVGVNLRYRLIEEGFTNPALTLGYDSQGFGNYIDSTSRYQEKSVGLFAVASKNFNLLGFLGIHAGINYSFEREDDKSPNLFVGIDKSINPELALTCEYDFALNDNDDDALGSGKGYLNAALHWTFAGRLRIDFILKNVLKNRKEVPYMSRAIRISYIEIF